MKPCSLTRKKFQNFIFSVFNKGVLAMILYILKWDIIPEKVDTYLEWTGPALRRSLSVSGVIEARAYRPMAGSSQVAIIYEFPDFDAWSNWFNDHKVQTVFEELFELATNVYREVWEPSPIFPEPFRSDYED
jgi:antibiotic biosynthesis monooxygenase (ABM) superfamily enzyme